MTGYTINNQQNIVPLNNFLYPNLDIPGKANVSYKTYSYTTHLILFVHYFQHINVSELFSDSV